MQNQKESNIIDVDISEIPSSFFKNLDSSSSKDSYADVDFLKEIDDDVIMNLLKMKNIIYNKQENIDLFLKVSSVTNEKNYKILECVSLIEEEDDENLMITIIRLEGMWNDIQFDVDDIIYIKAFFDIKTNSYLLNNGKKDEELLSSFIIVEPDIFITPTTIKYGIKCLRKSFFNENFFNILNTNITIELLIGKIMHKAFESLCTDYEKLRNNKVNKKTLEDLIKVIIDENFILEISLCKDIKDIHEFNSYLSNFIDYLYKYWKKSLCDSVKLPNFGINRINKIDEVEKVIFSNTLGIKGIVDIWAELKDVRNGQLKKLPLEIKTGKRQSEDSIQLILYCLILSDVLQKDLNHSYLIYLKDFENYRVDINRLQAISTIVIRNQLAKIQKDIRLNKSKELPPIDNPIRLSCKVCFKRDVCFPFFINFEKTNKDDFLALSSKDQELSDCVEKFKFNTETNKYFNENYEFLSNEEKLFYLEFIDDFINRNDIDTNSMYEFKLVSMISDKRYYILEILYNPRSKDDFTNFKSNKIGDDLYIMFPENKKIYLVKLESKRYNDKNIYLTCRLIKDKLIKADRVYLESDAKLNFVYIRYEINWSKYVFNQMKGNLICLCTGFNPDIRDILINCKSPDYDYNEISSITYRIKSKFEKEFMQMNFHQRKAILKSITTNNYSCIIGYPGSGKTTVIVLLIKILVQIFNKKVLIITLTNSALDHLLKKYSEYDKKFIRISNNQDSVDHDIRGNIIWDNSFKNIDEARQYINHNKIFASTYAGVGHKLLSSIQFDYCIIDEAGQILETALIGPLLLSKKFILVGDPNQLAPIVKSSSPVDSLISRLYKAYPDKATELTDIYRLNGELLDLANEVVYKGKLNNANLECKNRKINIKTDLIDWDEKEYIWLKEIINPDNSIIFIDYKIYFQNLSENHHNFREYNKVEIAICKRILGVIQKMKYDFNNIAIITPYKLQEQILKTQCIEFNFKNIYTIDKCQGMEKDIIIISFVKTDKRTRLLTNLPRINVALTRARSKLIIIGYYEALNEIDELCKVIKYLNDKKNIYELPYDCNLDV